MDAPKHYTIGFTKFVQIDDAMLKIVRALSEFENAQYSNGEYAALQKLIRAAAFLRKTIKDIEKEVNDAYDNRWLE